MPRRLWCEGVLEARAIRTLLLVLSDLLAGLEIGDTPPWFISGRTLDQRLARRWLRRSEVDRFGATQGADPRTVKYVQMTRMVIL